MVNENHYDVIIIGSGAGGGTLAYKLAPTGKRILILERGGYVPREKDNWRSERRQSRRQISDQREVARQGRQRTPSAHQLLRRRQHEILRRGAVSPAQRRFRRDQTSWRRLAGLADLLRRLEPYYTRSRAALSRARQRGEDPTEPRRSAPIRIRPSATSRASSSSPTISRGSGCIRFTRRSGVMLDEKNPHASKCIRCETCDGFPCLVYAKSDAQVCAVDPALQYPMSR